MNTDRNCGPFLLSGRLVSQINAQSKMRCGIRVTKMDISMVISMAMVTSVMLGSIAPIVPIVAMIPVIAMATMLTVSVTLLTIITTMSITRISLLAPVMLFNALTRLIFEGMPGVTVCTGKTRQAKRDNQT